MPTRESEWLLLGSPKVSAILLVTMWVSEAHEVGRHVGYNILDVAYGIDNDKKDYLLELAEEVMHMFGLSCEPGQFFVDEIPFCESALLFIKHLF